MPTKTDKRFVRGANKYMAKNLCNHCGGNLIDKYGVGEVACMMCGRPANHYCQDCSNVQTFKNVMSKVKG